MAVYGTVPPCIGSWRSPIDFIQVEKGAYTIHIYLGTVWILVDLRWREKHGDSKNGRLLGSMFFWLVVWNIWIIFHNMWDVILPIDELIFFEMVKTTNQFFVFIPSGSLQQNEGCHPSHPKEWWDWWDGNIDNTWVLFVAQFSGLPPMLGPRYHGNYIYNEFWEIYRGKFINLVVIWLVVSNMNGLFVHFIHGMSSFPLTNSIIFQDG